MGMLETVEAAIRKKIQDQEIVRLKKTRDRSLKLLWAVYRFITLFSLSMILLFPILYMISMAFRPALEVSDPMVIWLPKTATFKNVIDAFHVMNYVSATWNTMRFTLISSLLTIFSCSIAGYGFARFRFRFRQPLFMLVLLVLIVPPQNILISTFLQFRDFDLFGIGSLIGLFTGKPATINLIGSEFSLYLPALFGSGIRSGLYILIFNKFFTNLPKELEEASYIDGCGVYRTFVKVMLPNASAALLTVFLFSIVWYWNDYFFVSVYMQNSTTLSIQLTRLKALLNEALNPLGTGTFVNPSEITVRLLAGCLLMIAPLIVLYIFLQKYFTDSIERTGIVG